MARIPQEIIEQIFTTARIEEVIGEFVQLKKSGSNLKGLYICRWNNDVLQNINKWS